MKREHLRRDRAGWLARWDAPTEFYDHDGQLIGIFFPAVPRPEDTAGVATGPQPDAGSPGARAVVFTDEWRSYAKADEK